MKSKITGTVGMAIFVLMLCTQFVNAEKAVKQEETTCETLLVEQCNNCHYLTRVCQKMGKKSKGDWRRSVKRMVRKGAILSKDEQTILVTCLHKETEGALKACSPYR